MESDRVTVYPLGEEPKKPSCGPAKRNALPVYLNPCNNFVQLTVHRIKDPGIEDAPRKWTLQIGYPNQKEHPVEIELEQETTHIQIAPKVTSKFGNVDFKHIRLGLVGEGPVGDSLEFEWIDTRLPVEF